MVREAPAFSFADYRCMKTDTRFSTFEQSFSLSARYSCEIKQKEHRLSSSPPVHVVEERSQNSHGHPTKIVENSKRRLNRSCLIHLDESNLIQRFKDHILTVSINGRRCVIDQSVMTMRGNLFTLILKIFPRVQCLKFYAHVRNTCSFVFFADQPSIFSSTLVELHINTYFFEHCLYLLDGRFDRLRTLIVDTVHIWSLKWTRINTVSSTNKRSSSTDYALSVSRNNYST